MLVLTRQEEGKQVTLEYLRKSARGAKHRLCRFMGTPCVQLKSIDDALSQSIEGAAGP